MTAGTEESPDRLERLVEQNAEAIRFNAEAIRMTDAAVRACADTIEAMAKRTQERCDQLARSVEDVVRLNHDHKERLDRLEAR